MPRFTSVALGAGVAIVLCVPLAVSAAAGATSEVLISRGRPTVASSELSASTPAGYATDAGAGTRWAGANGAGSQWVRVDLGFTRRVDRVVLRWAKDYARSYRVQISLDGANWGDLYATRGGDGGTDDLKRLNGNGRYLRVLATQRPAASGGYSLWDFQAYGPAVKGPVLERAPVVDAAQLAAGLESPRKKEITMELVASAENSTLDWRGQFGYIADLHDGRGYTGGIIGFCSGTDDMLDVVQRYSEAKPSNPLARFLPALRAVDGSDSHAGLDPGFTAAWKAAASDPVFQRAQELERDTGYFVPSVRLAKADGVRALGQYAYYDAAVMHGVDGLRRIRAAAMRRAPLPVQGGDEIAYLNAFLDARVAEMRTEPAHDDTTRVDTAQRPLLRVSDLDLDVPMAWKVYGDTYRIN